LGLLSSILVGANTSRAWFQSRDSSTVEHGRLYILHLPATEFHSAGSSTHVEMGVGGGFYSYKQTPYSSQGPLFNKYVAFGGGQTAPASTVGLQLNSTSWWNNLGLATGLQAFNYSVDLTSLHEQEVESIVSDWAFDIQATGLAAYPVEAGSMTVRPAARLGGQVNDVMVYQQGQQGDLTVLNYGPMWVPSVTLGGQIGAHFSDSMEAEVGYTACMANGTTLYSQAYDGSVRMALPGDISVGAGFSTASRDTKIYLVAEDGEKELVGAVEDRFTLLHVGVGYSL
ncbi:MAG: hypothetical protein QGG40_02420, partial [Myxococcota bacterium]|nr:hypothetical protein [Myxococcota bacterium]